MTFPFWRIGSTDIWRRAQKTRAVIFSFCLFVHSPSVCRAAEEDRILLREMLPRVATQVVTEAEVSGQRCWMMVDTGADFLYLDNSLEHLVNPKGKKATATTADGTRVDRDIYQAASLKAQALKASSLPTILFDLSSISRSLRGGLVGFLGMHEMSAGKVLIDYDRRILEIHTGPWRLEAGDSHEEELDRDRSVPVFAGTIEDHEADFLIDTGSDSTISLPPAMFSSLVEKGVIEASSLSSSSMNVTGRARPRSRGWFLKGELMGKKLAGMAVSTGKGTAILGLKWLFGFNCEIDFAQRKFRYQKRDKAEPPIDVQMMTGAIMTYRDEGLKIESLRPDGGGAAEAAGLKAGDFIERFGPLKLEEMTAVTIGETVADNAGKPIQIRYFRPPDTTRIETQLQIPPPISAWDFSGRDIFKASK